jgi:hypothetical protein
MILRHAGAGPTPSLDIPLDARVVGFTIGVTVMAALLFGLVPAIAAFVTAPAPALRQAIGAPPRARRLFGNGLVIAQVAISVALLSVSQLSIAHLRHLRDRSLGFDRDRVLLLSVDTSRAQTRAQMLALYRELSAPAGDSRRASGCGERHYADCARRGEPFPAGRRIRRTRAGQAAGALNWVSPNYFATYGNAAAGGTGLSRRDSRTAAPRHRQPGAARGITSPAAIRLAGRVWLENEREPYEIVGVAGDAKYHDSPARRRRPSIVCSDVTRIDQLSLRTDVSRPPSPPTRGAIVTEVLGADSVRA